MTLATQVSGCRILPLDAATLAEFVLVRAAVVAKVYRVVLPTASNAGLVFCSFA
jgi:hypothetical protein